MRSAYLALAACAFCASCGLSGRGVDVTLVFDATVSDADLATITSLTFLTSGDETGTYVSTLDRAANRTERIEYIPRPSTRMLTLAVDAKNLAGIVVAHGASTSVTVPAHSRVAVTVPLISLVTVVDGGVPDADSGLPMFDFTVVDTGPPPNPCADGEQDNDETGIDCGGSCPLACMGSACSSGSTCSTGVCDGVCIPASGPPFWVTTPYVLNTPRTYACGVQRLSDGALVVAGGTANNTPTGALDSTEILTPTGFIKGQAMVTAREGLACASDLAGNVYAVGGTINTGASTTSFEYFFGSGAWMSLKGSNGTHSGFGFSRLDSNHLILTDSGNGEIYNITSGMWTTQMGTMNASQVRENSATVLASDGNVYEIGGDDGPVYALVDSFSATGTTWTSRAPMKNARGTLGGAAAGDGRIYAIGGYNGTTAVTTVEAYIPAANRWTSTVAQLPAPRQQTATGLGPDGRIYVVGGIDASNTIQSNVYAYGPAVTLSPSTGNTGATVTVTMTNLASSALTNVVFDTVRVAQGTSDAAGGLTAVFPVPETASTGNHSITVTDLRSLFPVTATFTVN